MLRDIEVQAGMELGPLDIVLQLTGQVRVHYSGPSEIASYSIRQDGVIVSSDGIHTGTSTIAAAPMGTVEILLTMRADSTGSEVSSAGIEHSRTVEVTEGSQAKVEFRIEGGPVTSTPLTAK